MQANQNEETNMLPIFNASMRIEVEKEFDFINRKYELNLCINSILAGDKSILIGERGVGKSALVKQIQFELENNYDNVLPIYIQFSPINFSHSTHIGYVYHLLLSVINYIWTNILGYKMSSLYDDELTLKNEFTEQVKKIHKLIRLVTQNTKILNQKGIEADFFAKGNLQKAKEYFENLSPLSNQEMIALFGELCDDLRKYTEVNNLVFLCDEANLLTETEQIEIARELSNIFPMLSCSFLYVASIFSVDGYCSLHTDFFEQTILIEGFKNIEHSIALLQNRILQKDRVTIDDQVYELLHRTTRGNPRDLIGIMNQIIRNKTINDVDQITITPQDAQKACNHFDKQKLQNQKFYNKI